MKPKKEYLLKIFLHQYTNTDEIQLYLSEDLNRMTTECTPYARLHETLEAFTFSTDTYIDNGNKFLSALKHIVSVPEIIKIEQTENNLRPAHSQIRSKLMINLQCEKQNLWDIPAETLCDLPDEKSFHITNNRYRPDPAILQTDDTILRSFHAALASPMDTNTTQFGMYKKALNLGLQCDETIKTISEYNKTLQNKDLDINEH